MEYTFSSLLSLGWPLLAVPLIIHLINLRRHRRVEWAAMQFLLESQKKNRKWIILQQLLLLLLRTAAIAAVLFMLAGPVLRSQWGRIFGTGSTHHLFLLDDSYSMSDQAQDSSIFERAKQVVGVVLEQSAEQAGDQDVTLIPFSEAVRLSAGAEPSVSQQPLNAESLSRLQSELDQMDCSESDASASQAIHAAMGLPEPAADESRIVYLVSDFRSGQWEANKQNKQLLNDLRARCSQLHLVQCVEQMRGNLGIVALEPEQGIRGAGVETWFQLTVANFSDEAAVAVSATVLQNDQKLPSVVFDEIPPHSEATRRFRVSFAAPGAHRLLASLERDAVTTDNTRHFACQVPAAFPVLIVDGSPAGDDGFYLGTALQPGGRTTSGWSLRVEPPSFLRRHDQLSEFAAICLLDVPRLDEPEVAALEEYVQNGGGLAIFLGTQTQRSFYNERLYRDGDGVLPAPLDVPTQLLSDSLQTEPDLVVSDHPLFEIFSGQRNSFLPLVKVDFYYSTEPDWTPSDRGEAQVIARLRNGAPFVIEKQFGDGRVVLQLSKLSPKKTDLGTWTNLSRNPVFPIYANELVGMLSAGRRGTAGVEVGEDLAFEVPESDYEPEFRSLPPKTSSLESQTFFPEIEEGIYRVDLGASETSGVWEFQLLPREQQPDKRLLAVNVVAGEGDLDFLGREQLAQRLEGIDYEFSLASNMTVEKDQLGGFKLADSLLYTLGIVLLLEQWLAVRASYHQGSGSRA